MVAYNARCYLHVASKPYKEKLSMPECHCRNDLTCGGACEAVIEGSPVTSTSDVTVGGQAADVLALVHNGSYEWLVVCTRAGMFDPTAATKGQCTWHGIHNASINRVRVLVQPESSARNAVVWATLRPGSCAS